jgi:hypothetical protein
MADATKPKKEKAPLTLPLSKLFIDLARRYAGRESNLIRHVILCLREPYEQWSRSMGGTAKGRTAHDAKSKNHSPVLELRPIAGRRWLIDG